MGSTTPKYAFPYPVGTDLLADGDNAIQALAQKVEDVLAGTGTGGRGWAVRLGTTGAVGANVWTAALSLPLTGCPVGAVVLVMASTTLSIATATASGAARFASVGATFNPATTDGAIVNQNLANGWCGLSIFTLATVTSAGPTVNMEVKVNSGTMQVHQETHMVGVRII